MLLDLLVEEAGIPNDVSEMLHRILNTAFHEGRLDRIKEEYNRLNPNDNAEKHTIQHIS